MIRKMCRPLLQRLHGAAVVRGDTRHLCGRQEKLEEVKQEPEYLYFHPGWDQATRASLARDMLVREDFLSPQEEDSLVQEVDPYMRRLRYEFDHWDDAIHGFRETERMQWNGANTAIIGRVRDFAFPSGTPQLKHVHVLDLAEEGVIKPHIDSVKFCGRVIAGLSLLTPCVMRLVHEKTKCVVDVLLKRRSLYIMKDDARYHYTHEILHNDKSEFQGKVVPKERRLSVICRCEP